MSLQDNIAQAMHIVANGMEDHETGEWRQVDEIKITYGVKNHGDFEIIIRRPIIKEIGE